MPRPSPHVATEGHTLHWARLYHLGTLLIGGRRIRSLHRGLLEKAGIRAGERVLDVGCGPGRLTLEEARAVGRAGEAAGLDASPEMIDLARRRAARHDAAVAFRVAAIEAIPWPDDHFDVVTASLMIHHLPAELQPRAVAEVRRVLKPNGRFVIGDFSARPGHGFSHIFWLLGLRHGSEHAEHLRALLTSAGFAAVDAAPAKFRAFAIVSGRKP